MEHSADALQVSEYTPRYFGAKVDFGATATLCEFYQKNLGTEPGRIVAGSATITTTAEVIALLRALLYTGCCRIEERSAACREIFLRACKGGRHLGTEELLATFVTDDSNPFVGVLQDEMRRLLNG